jgi:hypothetical protein
LNVAPDCESLYLKVAEEEATGLAGSEVMTGVGVVTAKMYVACEDGVSEPICASTEKVWDPPDDNV